LFGKQKEKTPRPIGIGKTLEEVVRLYKKRESIRFENRSYTYQELNEEANKVAGALQTLGIGKGDRVAIMLPNIPEFLFSFFGIQKLGAVAVPFNTMYKGREIAFILKDSGARAIICLSNFSNLIQEIQKECPDLEQVILTGQRTLVYVEEAGSVNIQMVFEKKESILADDIWRNIGENLVKVFHDLGAKEAWYSHKGAIRSKGKKLATILLSEIENLYICNMITYLENMDTDPLFKVIFVPPELKERALEPLTSLSTEAGRKILLEDLRQSLTKIFEENMEIHFDEGKLTRDELMAYEKNRALAAR